MPESPGEMVFDILAKDKTCALYVGPNPKERIRGSLQGHRFVAQIDKKLTQWKDKAVREAVRKALGRAEDPILLEIDKTLREFRSSLARGNVVESGEPAKKKAKSSTKE